MQKKSESSTNNHNETSISTINSKE